MPSVEMLVIGLGLIGSAATRHLANHGLSVAGLGPAEPSDWAEHAGPYASHYDSGRITRRLDARYEWAVLASRSIEEYAIIEQVSRRTFHHGTGLTFVRNDPAGIQNQTDVITRLDLNVHLESVANAGINKDLQFPPNWTALTEPAPAGFIDPRVMVEAQVAAATAAGARIHREAATSLDAVEDGWLVTTPARSISSQRVLLATGPYLQDLHGIDLQAAVRPESVVLGRVTEKEATRVGAMPSVIYLLDHPQLDDVYIVPPTQYPDGAYYIKMGGSHSGVRSLSSSEEKRKWMAGTECNSLLPVMSEVLSSVLPEVEFLDFHMKPCLITDTASGLPYVDQIGPGLFVAAGGNGHAAKSADAIGALAAGLMRNDGIWTDPELEQASFAARFGSWTPPDGSRHGS